MGPLARPGIRRAGRLLCGQRAGQQAPGQASGAAPAHGRHAGLGWLVDGPQRLTGETPPPQVCPFCRLAVSVLKSQVLKDSRRDSPEFFKGDGTGHETCCNRQSKSSILLPATDLHASPHRLLRRIPRPVGLSQAVFVGLLDAVKGHKSPLEVPPLITHTNARAR